MKNLLLLLVVTLFGTGFAFGQRVLVDFETVNQTIPGECFGMPAGQDGPAIGNCVNILANPDATGANPSDTVASYIEPAGGEPWMGVFFDVDTANSSPLFFSGDSSTLCMDAWLPVAGDLVLKLEDPGNSFAFEPAGVAATGTSAWEQICHDYAGTAAEGVEITRVVVFFNIGSVPGSETTYYWDNLQQLGATSIGGMKFGGFIKAYPNPVTDILRITDEISVPHTFVVTDIAGREVLRVENSLDGTIDVANLMNGAYFLRAVNERTDEVRTTRFLKN
ncbi:MAG: T9SS type A sorting domain-containing protein [Bacteroidota bacterium]